MIALAKKLKKWIDERHPSTVPNPRLGDGARKQHPKILGAEATPMIVVRQESLDMLGHCRRYIQPQLGSTPERHAVSVLCSREAQQVASVLLVDCRNVNVGGTLRQARYAKQHIKRVEGIAVGKRLVRRGTAVEMEDVRPASVSVHPAFFETV